MYPRVHSVQRVWLCVFVSIDYVHGDVLVFWARRSVYIQSKTPFLLGSPTNTAVLLYTR